MSCIVPSSILLFVFIIAVILISKWAGWVGEVQRSEQAEVRTQEREAECNRGRTTCRPAWDVPIGSSRSGGPESLPAGPACVFWGVGEMKGNQASVKNRRHPPRFADRGLWTIVFTGLAWSHLRWKQIYPSLRPVPDAPCHSHQHGPQLQEVIVLRVLHLYYSPGVQAAPHLLPLGLDLLVGSHHCKWDTGLEKKKDWNPSK